MGNQTNASVNSILEQIKTGVKMTKEQGFAACKSMLKEVCCRTVVIKIKDDCKWEWFAKNLDELKKKDPEVVFELEVLYTSSLLQPAWMGDDKGPIFANSLAQRLRNENTTEDISNYDIEWMMIL